MFDINKRTTMKRSEKQQLRRFWLPSLALLAVGCSTFVVVHDNDEWKMTRRSSSSPSLNQLFAAAATCTSTRRRAIAKITALSIAAPYAFACMTFFGRPLVATAAEEEPSVTSTVIRGRVALAPDLIAPPPSSPPNAATPALYVTVRPNRPDNVPAAILNGSRGKPPPVLSARIPLVSGTTLFPLDFDLAIPRDLTLEGAWNGNTPLPTDGSSLPIPETVKDLWWNKDELVVSARLDSDGVAATRSPEDLVGRGVCGSLISQGGDNNDNNSAVVAIQLSGRGAFGKFATGGAGQK